MTAADLLAPIRERADKATEGPWGAYAGCIRQERSWRDPSEVVVDYGGERPSVPNALFIAAARTDIPRLLAALDGVLALHYEAHRDFITADLCLREACDHEDVCPIESLPVCHQCWNQLEQIDPYFGEDHHVSEVMYPCPTVAAVVAALQEGE